MKEILKKFLEAYAKGNKEIILSLINETTMLKSNVMNCATGKEIIKRLELPMEDINVSIITITNYLEQDDFCIATFHHQHSIDKNNVLYPFIYGGKIALHINNNIIKQIEMDVEYDFGNTYIMHNKWNTVNSDKRRTLNINNLHPCSKTIKEVVYKCFLGLDLNNEKLFKASLSENILINRAKVNGESYQLNGINNITKFLKEDNDYYEQNQYSLHIKSIENIDEDKVHVIAWHLNPGKPGNKHIASHTKFTQFYDEVIDIIIVKEESYYKIQRIDIKRKENPVLYGYDFIEL